MSKDNSPALARIAALEAVVGQELPRTIGAQFRQLRQEQGELVETIKVLANAVKGLQQSVRQLEGRS